MEVNALPAIFFGGGVLIEIALINKVDNIEKPAEGVTLKCMACHGLFKVHVLIN